MNKLLKIGALVILGACASKSLNPYTDEYNELKKSYESGLPACQEYFSAMAALFVKDSNPVVLTKEKSKIFNFIKYYRYPVEIIQNGHSYNNYIFKTYVQQSDEFEKIYEDYTAKDNFGEGDTCEETETVLSFYTALIPTLKNDFKRLTERESFIFNIKHYINSKKFMRNEPLSSALVDIKILDVLTKYKFTDINPANINKTIAFAEAQQENFQAEFKLDIKSGELEKLADEGPAVEDIKQLSKAHKEEMKLARKVRKKIKKLMKNF